MKNRTLNLYILKTIEQKQTVCNKKQRKDRNYVTLIRGGALKSRFSFLPFLDYYGKKKMQKIRNGNMACVFHEGVKSEIVKRVLSANSFLLQLQGITRNICQSRFMKAKN